MTKNEYLKTLAGNLNGHLTKEEIGDILRDYQEFFEDGAMQNEEEAQTAQRLGDPKEVAVQIVAESYIDRAQAAPTVRNLFKARAAVKAFSAMAFVLSIPLIMGVTALTVALAAAFLVLVAASLVIFSGLLMFLSSLPPSAAGLAAAVALAALFASAAILLLAVMMVRAFVRWMTGLFAKAIVHPNKVQGPPPLPPEQSPGTADAADAPDTPKEEIDHA